MSEHLKMLIDEYPRLLNVSEWNVNRKHEHEYQDCVAWLEKQYDDSEWKEIAANTYDAEFHEPWARELITTMFKNPLAKMSILDEEDKFILLSFYLDDPLNKYIYSAQRNIARGINAWLVDDSLERTSTLWRHKRV